MHFLKTLACILAVVLLSSCSSVVTNQPIGTETYQPNPEEWDGIWFSQDGMVNIKVTDPASGLIQVAWLEEKEGKLAKESILIKVLKGESWLFANAMELEGRVYTNNYFWALIQKGASQILIWTPNEKAFKAACDAKELDCEIKTEDDSQINKKQTTGEPALKLKDPSAQIILKDPPEKLVKTLESQGSRFIDWENPTVLIRLK